MVKGESSHKEPKAPKTKEGKVTKAAAKEKKPREKKPKDPDAPKRPTTAYFFFTAAVREETKAENPGASVTDLAKLMGKKWAELDDKAKAKYIKQNEEDKKRYEEEMKEYEEKKAE